MTTVYDLDRETFLEQFGTPDQCLKHLADAKWKDGFECRKCKATNFMRGKLSHSRRCKLCGYDESATAHSLFHKLKFGIDKAFGMVYDISTSKKGANSLWLSEKYEVSQNTAWLFRHKAQLAMKSSKKHPLTMAVHVDEFEIGTPKKGQYGRSASKEKTRVVIAIEYRGGRAGRGYALEIKDFSAASLETIFTEHIDKAAYVKTDEWTGYMPLKKDYPNLTQEKSEKGLNFPMIHHQIRNIKNWLRGVHSFCSQKHIAKYLDEYFFRFNRRNHRKSIFNNLLDRMINHSNSTLRQIVDYAH